MIAKEMVALTDTERRKRFEESPETEDMYLEYLNKLNKTSTRIDELDLSIDTGIAAIIKLMMKKYKTEIMQEGQCIMVPRIQTRDMQKNVNMV